MVSPHSSSFLVPALLAPAAQLQLVPLPWVAQVDEPRLVFLAHLALRPDRRCWVALSEALCVPVAQALCRLWGRRQPPRPVAAWQAVLAVRQHEAHAQ